ncbi:MAG TPA: addiction module antidote protein, HigA family [Bacteroidales bacterium]|nr:addiction module antidote protein, HigA family [Bacteroidales bacterium]
MKTFNQYHPQSRPHPGETLAEKLEEMHMGPKEFALRTGKPEKTIIAVLKGESSITPDMAVQFENATRIPANFWMNHQKAYDEYIAREKNKEVINMAVPWAQQFPLAEMIKKGWLEQANTIQEKTMALLAFFGFSNHTAWENYFLNQSLKVAFRISLAQTNDPFAISAWLRKGEIQASSLVANEYATNRFRESLPLIRTLMANHPTDFFHQLQHICLLAGVKVVHTPCINKAPINGATRWLNNTPLIQLTGRYKRNDIFWFTFFHEAGHILLHGKKDVFLEQPSTSNPDIKKEREADDFAIKWTLSREEEAAIIASLPLDDASLRSFASNFNTHPAIIIGRLQHNKHLSYKEGYRYMAPVIFEE